MRSLQRRDPDTGRNARDEQPFIRLESALLDQHVVHDHERERHRSGFFPRKVFRHRDRLAGVHERVLGEGARASAHDAFARTDDLARDFLAGGLSRAGLDQPANDQLAAVQARGLDLHQQLARTRLRFGDFTLLEDCLAIHGLNEESFHWDLIPAALITLPQVSYSRFVYSASASGVPGSASTPCLSRSEIVALSFNALTICRLRRSTSS